MNKIIYKTLIELLLAIVSVTALHSQALLILDEKSKMTISGTSTLHDWDLDVNKIHLTGAGSVENGSLNSIESLAVVIPVKSLKSHNNSMDKNTYKALKEGNYPNIKFELISAEISNGRIIGKGRLTITDKSRIIDIESRYTGISSTGIQIKGEEKINMTDYNIEPPEVLFGSIVTGEDVIVQYDLYIEFKYSSNLVNYEN
ncbi:MAG: YceI family protein [Bacteroidales bacterium]|nr:YceI family protein [Bacteroidales bacterium]